MSKLFYRKQKSKQRPCILVGKLTSQMVKEWSLTTPPLCGGKRVGSFLAKRDLNLDVESSNREAIIVASSNYNRKSKCYSTNENESKHKSTLQHFSD